MPSNLDKKSCLSRVQHVNSPLRNIKNMIYMRKLGDSV